MKQCGLDGIRAPYDAKNDRPGDDCTLRRATLIVARAPNLN